MYYRIVNWFQCKYPTTENIKYYAAGIKFGFKSHNTTM